MSLTDIEKIETKLYFRCKK